MANKKIRLIELFCTNVLLANSVELNLILSKFACPLYCFVFQRIKFLNSVVPSHCETQPYDK